MALQQLTSEDLDHAIANRLGQAALPPPPWIVIKLLRVSQEPDVTFAEISELLSLDPELAAGIVRAANSPLHACGRSTTNVRQAVGLFGIDGTISLALGMSMAGLTPQDRALESVWARALSAAVAAQILATDAGEPHPEDAYLAALVQDIGSILLWRTMPDVYADGALQSHGTTVDAEIAALGTDHSVLGAEVLRSWGFDDCIIDAVRHSHDSLATSSFDGIVRAAGAAADALCGDTDRLTFLADHLVSGQSTMVITDLLARIHESVVDLAPLYGASTESFGELATLQEQAHQIFVSRLAVLAQRFTDLEGTYSQMEDRVARLEAVQRQDPLTRVGSRVALDELLEREFRAALTGDWPLLVAYIDVDDFKGVNDQHGHDVGDALLKEIAATMARAIRSTDAIARYGGDEFVFLGAGIELGPTRLLLGRLLREVRQVTVPGVDGTPVSRTVSIGAAIHYRDHCFHSARDLLRAADEALYDAKRQGRNRVALYDAVGGWV